MPWAEVSPVVDPSVRGLCRRPYPGHPAGCPNHGRVDRCPPRAPLLRDLLDLSLPTWVVWVTFDLGSHVARMRVSHPGWSERQLRCCLYWQGTARRELRGELARFAVECPGLEGTWCPEALGVDVTATMRKVGVELEWPPRGSATLVALVGTPNLAGRLG
jgi:hypothetical protein